MPFACAAPLVCLNSAGSASASTSSLDSAVVGGGEASKASAMTGSVAASGVGAENGEAEGVDWTLPVFCALAAARAAFSSWRFSARARAFCFLRALLVGFALDSDEL